MEPGFKNKLIINIDNYLKLVEPIFAKELYSLIEKNRVELREWLPWLDYIKSEKDEEKLLQINQKKFLSKGTPTMIIFHKEKIAGIVSFNNISWIHKSASIGYWLGKEFQGQGIMLNAIKEIISHGFNDLHLNRIEIKCASKNYPSRKIPEKLDFIHEGTQRESEWLYDHFVDLEIYSLLKKDWH